MIPEDRHKWQEEAERLRIEPSARLWRRLESRLDQDRHKIYVKSLRSYIMAAASILLIFTCTIYFWLPQQYHTSEMHLEDLTMVIPQPPSAAYYHVSDINSYYRDHNWRGIIEGEHKPLRASSAQQSAIEED